LFQETLNLTWALLAVALRQYRIIRVINRVGCRRIPELNLACASLAAARWLYRSRGGCRRIREVLAD
jgi:hypothetical protein